MASSDDEGEAVSQSVSNYHFVDEKDEPISFSILPIQWSEGESPDGQKEQIFLHGTADNGLQIYKQVTTWKFDISDVKPEISVLSKENSWIKLQKPRKSFGDTIRTILITVECLHFVKKNQDTSAKSMWNHLSKVFSLYEIRPSENDLVDHMALISEAVKRDEALAKSKVLSTFLEDKPRKRKAFDEDVKTAEMSGFIVDDMDDDMIDVTEEDESDEEGDLFDSVCAICDNGGDLLCCEGKCMRSFHATVDAGGESMCESLGLSDDQVEAIQNFYCKNCQYKKHQCFSCGKLGSSDKSSGAEVFPCVSATCGRFYHPQCVAKLLHREDEAAAEELQKRIAAGEFFTCAVHKCHVCKEVENKKDPELQFAVCRRCPKSYHKKCLPRKIAFEDLEDEGIIQRAWEGLMPNRILIYCLKHDIDDDLGTPMRNHIIFPNVEEKKNKRSSELLSSREKVVSKKRSLAPEDSSRQTAMKAPKRVEKLSSAMKEGDSTKKREKRSSGPDPIKKMKVTDTSKKSLNNALKSVSMKVDKSSAVDGSRTSLGDQLYSLFLKGSDPAKPKKQDAPNSELERTTTVKPVANNQSSSLPLLDADSQRRIMALMKDSTSSITLEEIIRKHKVPSTHAYSSRNVVDKTITQGKVEGAVEALRTALQKLEEGCNIEDAKAVCEPEIVNQIIKWKNKLKVYLAPFLHGMRYTSFGRHFTKVEKLKEIVDKLHWYAQNGDMIVDFCCGANDFSCLMKKKLEEMGKRCSYKNYDFMQPKNDFNYEKRDWMTVRPKELPTGSQLIMGLNPPFGVRAALANKFINKALEFKPKLLILIVPQETERPDKKNPPYDLVWEDDEKLSGKSFYLPGSVDVNDKQMDQWNVKPPLLFLWSRRDWTSRHKTIAEKHGHLSRGRKELLLEENHDDTQIPNNLMEEDLGHHPVQNYDPGKLKERRAIVTEDHKESSPRNNGDRGRENHANGKNGSNEKSKKRQRGKGKQGRHTDEISPEDKQNGERPHRSPPNVTDDRSSLEGYPSKPLERPSHTEVGEEGYRHFQPSISISGSQFGAGYGGTPTSNPDDMARRYSLNSEDPYPGGMPRWSMGASPGPDYGIRNLEGYIPGYRPYIETDMRSDVRLYGQRNPDSSMQRSSYLAGHDSGFSHLSSLSSTYGHLGSAADSSYNRINTSAMQRYAPRLDELNHTRMSTLGSEPPMVNRNGIYDPLSARPGFRADSMGFAPGPHRPFSHQSSSGWLNE